MSAAATRRWLGAGGAILVLSSCGGPAPAGRATAAATPAPVTTSSLAVRVVGNTLVDAGGTPIRIVGVNRIAGFCTRPAPFSSIIYGPSDSASVDQMASWNINVVRLTLNEDCWLGINGAPAAFSGSVYRNAIVAYVNLLHSRGIFAIIDLHGDAPGTTLSVTGQAMADEDHAPAYWTSVATTFAHDPATVFEPYNEPHITTSNALTTNPWDCWLNGCTITQLVPGEHQAPVPLQWSSAGMQQLVDTIRATGAANVITLSGLSLASDLSGIITHLPQDPLHQLAATFHNYGQSATQNGGCGPSCWDSVIAPLAARLPVITDELGEPDCQTSYVSQYMSWADQHGVSYLPWVWTTWGCTNHGYGLLSDWSGTPNSYGAVFRDHFRSLPPPTEAVAHS
ncbi:MAG: cellulase family glycosylhydrolase [Candidatus Dormibacteria bacterium]